MFVGFLTWWYGDGLSARVDDIGERLARVGDFFSVGLLARTLFSPFRQISVGSVRGSLSVQLQAFFDNLTSRLIGGFVRSAMIVFAAFAWFGTVLYGLVVVAGWLVLPLLPLCGVIAMIISGVI